MKTKAEKSGETKETDRLVLEWKEACVDPGSNPGERMLDSVPIKPRCDENIAAENMTG